MGNVFGSEFRRVENREHLGKTAIVAVAIRTYDTSVLDLWEAVTTPARLARWFAPVDGDLRLGGRYQVKGNASGTITRCEPPEALDLTWEIMGGTSWVNVRLTPVGAKARLTLEHIAHKDGIGEAHLKQFGPGAVGIGWDLGLMGLARHLANPSAPLDHAAFEAWARSDDGKAFLRSCGEAWGAADAAAGESPDEARAKAERTIAFYTGG
ncbi:MAG: SRPBCC family protein [Deltaproteobacteria bacterium]|nr:SRPBCC family protein [Deltaproteobacteria bacterium]